jgi:flavin-binding protein dodecin
MTRVEDFEKTEEETAEQKTKLSGVVKIIEVIGTSETSFDDAIATAIKTASRSLRHVTGADIKHMTVAAKEGKVTEYRVDLKLAFALDFDDADDD